MVVKTGEARLRLCYGRLSEDVKTTDHHILGATTMRFNWSLSNKQYQEYQQDRGIQ